MKFAIISPVLPPSTSGQAVVLYQMLKEINPDQFIAISPKKYENRINDSCTEKLKAKYYHLPGLHPMLKILVLLINFYRIHFILNIYLEKRIKKYVTILKENNCELGIACTADLLEPYAVFFACKQLKIPFYFYIFDDYILQWTHFYERYFVKKHGDSIIRGSDKIIVVNEFLKTAYDSEYGVNSEIIHNPVELDNYPGIRDSTISESEIKIIYTGDVGEAHYDAFRNLIHVLNQRTKKRSIQLHIYTSRSESRLIKEHINGIHVTIHPHQHISAIPAIQQSADILFLPLSFNSVYPDFIMKTASPGKMGEFLAAGRPILAHVPKDSFVSWYLKKHCCGIVVDTKAENNLSSGVDLLINDEILRKRLSLAAKNAAKRDFDSKNERKKFAELVSI